MNISNERLVSVAESAKQLLDFPCSKEQLDEIERKTLKRLAVELGQRASRMTDAELIDLYNSFDASKIPTPDAKGNPDPEEKGNTLKGTAQGHEGEGEGKGEGSQPKPSFEPQTPVEEQLADLIRRVHETIEHENGTDVEKVESMIAENYKSIWTALENDIPELIEKHTHREPVKIEVKTPKETIKPEGLVHEKLPQILKALIRGDRVMLVGGAGSGKTFMAQQMHKLLSKALDQEDFTFGMSGAMYQAYEVRGYMDATGNYVESSFIKCFRDGGLFLFDEIDGSNPQALVALNASLENDMADFPCGVVKRHPNFRMIACANTYGRGADREYVGRNQLDGATLDRFKPIIDLDYDVSLELAITPNQNFTKVCQLLRKAKDDMKIRHIISPRASIAGGKAIVDGEKFTDVLDNYVLSGLDKDTRNRIINEAGGMDILERLNKRGSVIVKREPEQQQSEGGA